MAKDVRVDNTKVGPALWVVLVGWAAGVDRTTVRELHRSL